jgi:hypothetical protein
MQPFFQVLPDKAWFENLEIAFESFYGTKV